MSFSTAPVVQAQFRMLRPLQFAAFWILALGFAPGLMAQGRGMGPCCSGPPVELKGRIVKVQITPGEGMPNLILKTADDEARVYLGSMRYLMANGFNPKVGEEAIVRAFKTGAEYVAMTVTLPSQDKTLRLRDEEGRPLWRGGPRGRMMR